MAGRRFAVFMCMALLGNAFAVPTEIRRRRQVTEKTVGENEVSSQEISVSMKNYGQDASTTESPNTYLPATQSTRGDTPAAPSAPDDDDDDDDFPAAPAQPSGGGSSIFSILNLISALFPGSSGSNVSVV